VPLRGPARTFLPLLAYTGLAVLLFHNGWASPGDRVIGGHGDPEASIWYYAWIQHALGHGANPLLSDFLNFPDGVNLAWQTSQPLVAVVSWPVSAIAGPYVAFNAVATAALAVSAWCAFLAIRRWVPGRWPAFAGGLLYGFSPYMAAQSLGHVNLTLAFVPPLLVLLLDEVLVRRRWPWWRAGLVLGLLAAVQLYVSEEILATSALMALVVALTLAAMHRDRWRAALPHLARVVALAAVVAVALGAPLLHAQFAGPHRLPGIFQHPGGYSTDLLNFVVPTRAQQLDPAAAQRIAAGFTGNGSEENGYLSLPFLLLLAYTVWRRRRLAWVRVAAIAGAVAALLSMGPTLHVAGHGTRIPLPWVVFEHLPVFGNLLPARLMLYAFLAAAMLLALAVDDLLRARGRTLVAGTLLLAASLALLLPRFDFLAAPEDDPAFFTAGGDVQRIPEGASVLVAPFADEAATAPPETWQVLSGMRFRQPAGYFLQPDPGTPDGHLIGPVLRPLARAIVDVEDGRGAPQLTPALLAQMRADLRYWGTRAVVAGPWPHRAEMVQLLTTVLGAAPQQDQGVDVWWDVTAAAPAPGSG